jgi:hypothetical protein
LVLDAGTAKSDKNKDKQLLAETSSTSSLGELNQLLKRKTSAGGKENKIDRGNAHSRASKSTAAMSQAVGGGFSTLGMHQGGSMAHSQGGGAAESDLYNMSAFDRSQGNATGGVMDYPYMFDNTQQDELQFADKIKMLNSKKSGSNTQKGTLQPTKQVVSAASGDALSSILIQTFVEMMQVEGDLERRRRELAMR